MTIPWYSCGMALRGLRTGIGKTVAVAAALALLLAACGDGGGGSASAGGRLKVTVAALPLTDSAALYLARAAFVTGTTLEGDGGYAHGRR